MTRHNYSLLVAVSICILLIPALSHGVAVPWTMNFDSAGDWSSYIYVEAACVPDSDKGVTSHVTDGCYSGGCMKIVPPRSPCTGGGINGGSVGIWPTLTGAGQTIYVRFLMKFGPTHRDNTASGGGTTMNKFVNLWTDSGREGILKTQVTIPSEDPRGLFLSMAVMTDGEGYIYESSPSRGWIQDSDLTIDLGSANNYTASDADGKTWLSVEYMIDKVGGSSTVWVYDNTGLIQTITTPRSSWEGGNFTSLQFGGYYNAYVTYDADNYVLIDNLQVSTSYIGPPAGFVGGGGVGTISNITIGPGVSMR